MSVAIVTASKTDEVACNVARSLRDVTEDIQIITPELYVRTCKETKYLVKIFVASETLLEIIQNLGKLDVESLLQPYESIIVKINDTAVDSSIDDKLSKTVENWSGIKTFDANRILQAEDHIRKEIIHNAEKSFSQRYVIHPETVSQLFETEIMIVLGDDVNKRTETVTVHFHGRKIDAVKKQTNIWTFNIVEDMKPGVKIFRIVADDDDLGQSKCTVMDTRHVAEQALANLRDTDARTFLADLLRLNINDFDLDLADILAGSSCMQLVENILKYGDHTGYRYPTILHLCARYGLSGTFDWCKRTKSCKNKFSVEDKTGKTAEQVAKEEQPDDKFCERFQDDGSDFEDLGCAQRFRISDSFKTGARDSGRSSSGSFGATPLRKNSQSSQRKRLPSDPGSPLIMSEPIRPYDFARRVEHPYDEISERESESTLYNSPWEQSPFAANLQTLTAGVLSNPHHDSINHGVTSSTTTENTHF